MWDGRGQNVRKVTLKRSYSSGIASRLLGEEVLRLFVWHPRFSYIFGLVGSKVLTAFQDNVPFLS